jgi:hypothetical protein
MSGDRASDTSLIDTHELLFYVLVGKDGVAIMGGRTRDWEWVAASLRHLAEGADAKAKAAS